MRHGKSITGTLIGKLEELGNVPSATPLLSSLGNSLWLALNAADCWLQLSRAAAI
jgi:hypothetical protein